MQLHCVLIDDDPLVHMTWKAFAKRSGKNVAIFHDLAGFETIAPDLPKDTPIYVDSALAANVRGEELALGLYNRGFTNLYLCTGYDPSDFPPMHWIRAIVGKEPNF